MKRLMARLGVEPSELLRPSVIALMVANIAPIVGLALFDWQVFPLLFLFWLENLVIGGYTALKMLLVSPAESVSLKAKLGAIAFFCIHYGLFTLVHGMFILVFFGGLLWEGMDFPDPAVVAALIGSYRLGWAVLALATSHGVSLAVNYLGNGEYRQATLSSVMQQPYGRVVVLHLIIIGGGFLTTIIGSPEIALIALVLLKIGLDVRAHLREHGTARGTPPERALPV